MEEFEEEVKDFSPEKENIKDKVDDFFEKEQGPFVFCISLLSTCIAGWVKLWSWQNHAPITIKDMMKK
jgi:cytoskeletal protein RodZ